MSAAQQKTPKKPITLRGRPGTAMTALVPAEGEARRTKDVVVRGYDVKRARIDRVAQGLERWTVQVPPNTPPGSYPATICANGREVDVVLCVERSISAQISPNALFLEMEPGGRTQVSFTIRNTGNVAIELPKSHAFGLFEAHGLEAAIAAAYASEQKGLDRLAVAIEEAAQRHAFARVKISNGPLVIEPNQHLQFEAQITWPTDVTPDRRYNGNWFLGPVGITVRAHTAPAEVAK